MKNDIPRLKADFFKAIAHPLRIRVLELLSEGEKSVSELIELTGAEQSQLSQQLAVLRRGDFVQKRREGSLAIYELTDERVKSILGLAREILIDRVNATQLELSSS